MLERRNQALKPVKNKESLRCGQPAIRWRERKILNKINKIKN